MQKYIKTKFVTYLLYLNAVSHNFNAKCFSFVPSMDFTQEWDDDKLNKHFNLDETEIKRINDLFAEFRPMKGTEIDDEGEDTNE